MISLRAARPADFPVLQEIERAAGEIFRRIGMGEIADDDPPTIDELRRYADSGLAWVAESERDAPAAYLLAEPVDAALHIEQVSVHPRYARQRIGRRLIGAAEAQARSRFYPSLTLTTFTDVPWNAPYYRRLGFMPVEEEHLTPGLAEIRRREADLGLDRWPRICMRKDLAG